MSKTKSLVANLTDVPVSGILVNKLQSLPVRLLSKPSSISAFDDLRSENEYPKEWLSELNDSEIINADPPNLGLFKNYLSTNLRWCQSTFAGPDATVNTVVNERRLLERVENKQLFITRVGAQLSVPMSEYVVSMIIRIERRFDELIIAQNAKSWTNRLYTQKGYTPIKELKFCILGIGMFHTSMHKIMYILFDSCKGDIGCSIAKSLKFGFDARKIVGLSKTAKSDDPKYQTLFNECYVFEEIDQMFAENTDIDYIINCLPSTASTKYLLNSNRLGTCTKRPFFINVGRGDVIKSDELVNCLNNDVLCGACLDVFENEPLDCSNPLWNTKNVIITPHISALTFPEDVVNVFMNNLEKYRNGEPLEYVVDIDAGY